MSVAPDASESPRDVGLAGSRAPASALTATTGPSPGSDPSESSTSNAQAAVVCPESVTR